MKKLIPTLLTVLLMATTLISCESTKQPVQEAEPTGLDKLIIAENYDFIYTVVNETRYNLNVTCILGDNEKGRIMAEGSNHVLKKGESISFTFDYETLKKTYPCGEPALAVELSQTGIGSDIYNDVPLTHPNMKTTVKVQYKSKTEIKTPWSIGPIQTVNFAPVETNYTHIYKITNNSTKKVTIANALYTTDLDYRFGVTEDYVLQPGETIELKYNSDELIKLYGKFTGLGIYYEIEGYKERYGVEVPLSSKNKMAVLELLDPATGKVENIEIVDF